MSVYNPETPLRIRSAGRVNHVDSVGDHDFDLSLYGSFDAHEEILDSTIILDGNLTASRPVALGNQELKCRNAELRHGLTSAGIVSSERLEVHGDIQSHGVIMARDLRCTGILEAEHLVILGSIEVAGS